MANSNRAALYKAVDAFQKKGVQLDATQVKSNLIFSYIYEMIPALFMGLVLYRLDDKGFFGYCFLMYCVYRVTVETLQALRISLIDAETMTAIVIQAHTNMMRAK